SAVKCLLPPAPCTICSLHSPSLSPLTPPPLPSPTLFRSMTFLNPEPRLMTWKPPESVNVGPGQFMNFPRPTFTDSGGYQVMSLRSEEHTSELQSRFDLVCRLLLEKKQQNKEREDIRCRTP